MTDLPLHILAAGDVESLGFTIVAALIAIVGAIVSSAKKKEKDEAARRAARENWERIEQEMRQGAAQATGVLNQPGAYRAPPLPPGAAPPPLPPRPVFAPTKSIDGPYQPPRPAAAKPAPRRPANAPRPLPPARPLPPQQPRKPKRQKQAQQPAAAPVMARTVAAVARAAQAAEVPPLPVARPAQATAKAAALSKWLTPNTLRSQFILTEILQPPLALRDPNRPCGGL
jgi:hypothetical protein